MEAWLRMVMEMMEGVSLQASPSTCMGIVFVVMMRADLHCVMQVPCPPACSRGCNMVQKSTQIPVTAFVHAYFTCIPVLFNRLSLFYKQKVYVFMLSVCSCVLPLKPPNQLTDSHKTLYENHATESKRSPTEWPPPFSINPLHWLLQYTPLCSRFYSHNGTAAGSNLLGCYAVLNGKQKCLDF